MRSGIDGEWKAAAVSKEEGESGRSPPGHSGARPYAGCEALGPERRFQAPERQQCESESGSGFGRVGLFWTIFGAI